VTFKLTEKMVEEVIGAPFNRTAHQCHAISLQIIKSGVIPAELCPRVARGNVKGVVSQHSWIVLGGNCYNPDAQIIDPTLWSYDTAVKGVYQNKQRRRPHLPHGSVGNIWTYGHPPEPVSPIIKLAVPVGTEAEMFLDICGPLDINGWAYLAHAPVAGWPAADIIEAMADTPELSALVPIDILGMLTRKNPQGLYF